MNTFNDVFVNLARSFPSIIHLVNSFGFIAGMVFIFIGIYKLKAYGESRTMMSSNVSLKEPIVALFIGSMLLYYPSALGMGLTTIFNTSQLTDLSYVTSMVPSYDQSFKAILQLVQIVGLISFVRGWFVLSASTQPGRGGFGKGMTHLVGGVLAVNIAAVKQILWTTFGFV